MRSAAARRAAACPVPRGGIVRLALGPNDLPVRQIRFRCGVGGLPGARQSGSSVRVCARCARGTRRARRAGAARGAVFGARGQNLDCVDVVKAAPVARGRMATRGRAGVPSAD